MSFASHILSQRTLRPRHRLGLMILGVVVIWALVWGSTAYQLNKAVNDWIQSTKANGIAFSFSNRSINGTPLTVHVHLKDFHVQLPKGAYEVNAGEAVLYLSLWDWNNVSTKLRNKIEGTLAGLPFSADVLKIGFDKPENPPINEMETGFELSVQSMGLTFPPQEELALGNRLDQLSFDVRVMGTPPDFTNTQAIRAWNNASGVLEFDQLDVLWGPLALSAKGTVGLNNALQPEGAFSGKVEGLDAAIDKLVTKGTIEQRQEALLRSSISVLSHPSGLMAGASPIIPISVQNGALFLGPVRIMEIPQILWPDEEQPAAPHESE
ncbi:MAG: DUF2125 domain-containing protein [Alphaproteobacteria bacterium]|nr:DUF2125 domain-containing protein [Alphaproteobacteria bacterium]